MRHTHSIMITMKCNIRLDPHNYNTRSYHLSVCHSDLKTNIFFLFITKYLYSYAIYVHDIRMLCYVARKNICTIIMNNNNNMK